MAISPGISLQKVNQSSSSLKFLSKETNKKTIKIGKLFSSGIERKNNLWSSTKLFKRRRIEFEKRTELRDRLRIPLLVSRPKGPSTLSLGDKSTSITDRLLGFIGYVSAGWILGNLPTWIAVGEQFSSRVLTAGSILSNYGDTMVRMMSGIQSLFSAAFQNISKFDFTDSSYLVRNSLNDLKLEFDNLGKGLSEALDVFTKPLENIPRIGDIQPDQPTPTPTPTNQETNAPIEGRVLATNTKASWYNPYLGGINASGAKTPDGRPATSSGEPYITNVFSAAAFPELIKLLPTEYTRPSSIRGGRTIARPINLLVSDSKTGKSAVIRVNDSGPGVSGHSRNQLLDLSVAARDYFGSANLGSGLDIRMISDQSMRPGPISRNQSRTQNITPLPPQQPSSQSVGRSSITGIFNLEIHHPGYNETQRSGLIENILDPPNNVTKSFISEFGTYPRGFRDLGGPKRGLNLLELANEKGVDWNAQKIIKVIKKFPKVQFNLFAGHTDVALGTGGLGAPGELVFNPAVCLKVQQLAKSFGMNNVRYYPAQAKVSANDPRSHWMISKRLREEFLQGQTTQQAPPPSPTGQRRLQKGDIFTKSLGKDVDYIEVTSLVGEGRNHKGIDIAAPLGTYIALRVDCEVVAQGRYGNYGLLIDVWIPSLGIQLRMTHLSSVLITSGKIPAGTSFARVGQSGRTSGPHIHLEYDTKKGTRGGGALNDDPVNYQANLEKYVRLLYLTKNPNRGQFAPATSPSATLVPNVPIISNTEEAQSEAQFETYMNGVMDGITQERKGRKIVIIDDRKQVVSQQIITSGDSDIEMLQIPDSVLLNNFIKNKLLLDLNYV